MKKEDIKPGMKFIINTNRTKGDIGEGLNFNSEDDLIHQMEIVFLKPGTIVEATHPVKRLKYGSGLGFRFKIEGCESQLYSFWSWTKNRIDLIP